MKLRVYRTATESNADQVHIGIPQDLQLDPAVSAIDLQQVEILPDPQTLDDLSINPLVVQNNSLNASKSVGVSTLRPGYGLRAVPRNDATIALPELPIQEIILPDGYVHLDDLSDWKIFNYNKGYFATPKEFKPLPFEENRPTNSNFGLHRKGREFFVKYNGRIDSVLIYYRRASKLSEPYEWVRWEELEIKSEDTSPSEVIATFPYDGSYVFRAVPYYQGYPIGGYKDYKHIFKENYSLRWQDIQISKDSYIIRMQGTISQKITHVKILEKGKLLQMQKLIPNKNGEIDVRIIVEGVSLDRKPRLQYRFVRKIDSNEAYVFHTHSHLKRHYAEEDIQFRVDQERDQFTITIGDPRRLLYSSTSEIEPFSGISWQTAIQQAKLLCYLQIKRHQMSESVDYGHFLINVTQEKNSKFLEKPPFQEQIRKVGSGFSFQFKDSQEFRNTIGVSSPKDDEPITYEYRLLFWSAGIEEGLRTGNNYVFIKEESVVVRNQKRQYKRAYDTWSEEHPRRKYDKIIPRPVKFSHLNSHIRYGSSPIAYLRTGTVDPIRRTRKILMKGIGWKVLYYYNDKDDQLQEFPYYCFDVIIPPTAQIEIENLEIFVNTDKTSGGQISLGTFHGCPKIQICDFVGYFQAMKKIASQIDVDNLAKAQEGGQFANAAFGRDEPLPAQTGTLSAAAARIQTGNANMVAAPGSYENTNSSATSGGYGTGNMQTTSNTYSQTTTMSNDQMNDVHVAGNAINNSVAQRAEQGSLIYRAEVVYRDGSKGSFFIDVPIAERPRIEPEPQNNVSFSIGNKTFSNEVVQFNTESAASVIGAVESIPVHPGSSFSGDTNSGTSAGANDFNFQAATRGVYR